MTTPCCGSCRWWQPMGEHGATGMCTVEWKVPCWVSTSGNFMTSPEQGEQCQLFVEKRLERPKLAIVT